MDCDGLRISDELRLRMLAPEDAAALQALIAANRPYLAEWLPWAAAQTLADSEEFVRGSREQLRAGDGMQTAIEASGAIVGMAGFSELDWGRRSASIGYWLAREWQGRGIVTAAVRVLAGHAFTVWELDRVQIRAAVENGRSRAVPERLGFEQEGIQRRAERVAGRDLDLVVYARYRNTD